MLTAEAIDPARVIADLALAHGATPEQWASLEWRLDHLYTIVDKPGQTIPFVLNDQQRAFVRRLWYRNLILKARQLGFSTLIEVLQLDQALFNVNFTGVVIADTQLNASKLFKKIEFAYEHLSPALKRVFALQSKNTGSSIVFEQRGDDGLPQPSGISVGVSSRGGTVNLLHISELGKISLKFPQRADEIKTGALPSVPPDGVAIVESTAEGAFGLFYDLCEPAMKRMEQGKQETPLDWRLHFFPWYEAKEYTMAPEDAALVDIPRDLRGYFGKLEVELKITLTAGQRAWYAKTRETLGKKMKQEYPSTPKEAFEQAIEGAIYGDEMTNLRRLGRLTTVPVDANYPVDTIWDFGAGADSTGGGGTNIIWFHQLVGIQHRWFYCVVGFGKGLKHWWLEVCEKHRERHKYQWGAHYLPHDADTTMLGEVTETKREILDKLGMRNIIVIPRVATLSQGIEVTRRELGGNHWFYDHTPNDELGEDMGAGYGIKCLDAYQHEWDDKRGIWSSTPLHNWASHGADAWRQYAQAKSTGLVKSFARPPSLSQRDHDDYERKQRRARNWKVA